jgi:hypothetical protein
VCYSLVSRGSTDVDPAAAREQIARLTALGVTWLTVGFAGDKRADYVAALRRFGAAVIARAG